MTYKNPSNNSRFNLKNGLVTGLVLGVFGIAITVATPVYADSFGGTSESVRSSTPAPAPATIPAPAAKATAPAEAAAPARKAVTIPAKCKRGIDPSKKTICVAKTGVGSRAVLYAFQNNTVYLTSDVRTGDSGGSKTYTRDGVQKVEWRSRDHKSKELNNAPMPYALFFNDLGEAIHYSPTFDPIYKSGRANWGHSNGCVNIPNRDVAAKLFNWASVGTAVNVVK